jgi:adenosylhomocysteine nucleosidase
MELTKVLVTYATREELVRIDWEDVQTAYLLTGVGKMKSAYYLSDAIDKMQPDCVINIGTAGTVRHNVGDIFVCRSFIDRDMQKLKDFGVSFPSRCSSLREDAAGLLLYACGTMQHGRCFLDGR